MNDIEKERKERETSKRNFRYLRKRKMGIRMNRKVEKNGTEIGEVTNRRGRNNEMKDWRAMNQWMEKSGVDGWID